MYGNTFSVHSSPATPPRHQHVSAFDCPSCAYTHSKVMHLNALVLVCVDVIPKNDFDTLYWSYTKACLLLALQICILAKSIPSESSDIPLSSMAAPINVTVYW